MQVIKSTEMKSLDNFVAQALKQALNEENSEREISEQLKEDFEEDIGLEERKIRIIRNVIELMMLTEDLNPAEPLRELTKMWLILRHQIIILDKARREEILFKKSEVTLGELLSHLKREMAQGDKFLTAHLTKRHPLIIQRMGILSRLQKAGNNQRVIHALRESFMVEEALLEKGAKSAAKNQRIHDKLEVLTERIAQILREQLVILFSPGKSIEYQGIYQKLSNPRNTLNWREDVWKPAIEKLKNLQALVNEEQQIAMGCEEELRSADKIDWRLREAMQKLVKASITGQKLSDLVITKSE